MIIATIVVFDLTIKVILISSGVANKVWYAWNGCRSDISKIKKEYDNINKILYCLNYHHLKVKKKI